MFVFAGDKFIDAEGRDVTNDLKSAVWPVRVYHAPVETVSAVFGIYEATGPYKLVFEASNDQDLCEFQDSQW